MDEEKKQADGVSAEAEDAAADTAADATEPVCDVISHRRFGDRKDGRRVRSLSPMAQMIPYIMNVRSDAQNHIRETLNVDRILDYINEKRRAGWTGFGFMHVMIAIYIRAVAEYPGINRFINGQKIFARDGYIEVSLTIKKEMVLDSPDTVVKLTFRPDATAADVYNGFTKVINDYRDVKDSGFDKTVKFINYIPGLVKRFAVGFLKFLDFFGWLPRSLTRVSPFHSSLFITSMGSLGIPPIYHHLYNFGNVPVFCSFGVKQRKMELQRDGTVQEHSYIDVTFVTDERICDGYYFAASLKYMKRFVRDPWLLDSAPEEVKRDVD